MNRYYKNTTQLPNIILDHLLKSLTETELKVLLTVIRKTIGQIDPNDSKRRIERAWISRRLFCICTGKSERAVSTAINQLVVSGLISVTDAHSRSLPTASSRKGALRLYYAFRFPSINTQNNRRETSSTSAGKYLPPIKPTINKQSCAPISQALKKYNGVLDDQQNNQTRLHS